MDEFHINKYLINFNCPKCSKVISENIGKLKIDHTIICPTCYEYFGIQANELKKEINNIEMSFNKLRVSFNLR